MAYPRYAADTRNLLRLPAKETGGIYDRAPGFKDAENGDLSIAGREADDPGVRPEK